MTIRKLFIALALAALPLCSPAAAQDARELALARSIVEHGYPPETRTATFGAAMDQMVAQLNQSVSPDLRSDPKVMELVARFQKRVLDRGKSVLGEHMAQIMDGMAQGYVQEFSLAELEALDAFISSPEGRGFFSRSMRVVSDPVYARATQAFINDYMATVPAMQREFIDELTHLLMERDRAEPVQS